METEVLALPAPAIEQAPSIVETLQSVGDPPTESVLPKQYHDAYRMKLAGDGMQEIADRFNVDRTTVWRWCSKVEQEAQTQLANEPAYNVLVREMLRLTDLEEQCRTMAESAKSDRAKAMFLSEARRAAATRQSLLVTTGIIPKAPEQIFRVTATLKPTIQAEQDGQAAKPRDQALGELIDAMQKARHLG